MRQNGDGLGIEAPEGATVSQAMPVKHDAHEDENQRLLEARRLWQKRRIELETATRMRSVLGFEIKAELKLLQRVVEFAGLMLRVFRLEKIGIQAALDPQLQHYELTFENLPKEFDGFCILHLTDLHLDTLEGLPQAIAQKVALIKDSVDFTVITGDYKDKHGGPWRHTIPMFRQVVDAVPGSGPIYFTLGNHDSQDMLEGYECSRVIGLMNESVVFERAGKRLVLTGIDDVHRFYTPAAEQALKNNAGDFKVVITHTSELYQQAAAEKYDLYLNGHTHGGQICLPGGIQILSRQRAPRAFGSGFWRYEHMQGFTNRGAGVVKLPVRYYCPGEIAIFKLRSK